MFKHENLKGKVAVVTGGGGVLCAAFAKTLAKQGCKIAVLDLNEEAAQKCADEINADGGEAIAVGCNVLELESMENARKVINEKLGSCDILLNGAGGNNPKGTTTKDTLEKIDLVQKDENVKTFFDLDPNGISFVFNLNFLGTLIPTQVFAKDMAEKQKGTIIMITSMNAFRPLTRIPAYSAAKAAVKNFTEWMAVHFAPLGIRVNAIAPGFFSTMRMEHLLKEQAKFLPLHQWIDSANLMNFQVHFFSFAMILIQALLQVLIFLLTAVSTLIQVYKK